MNKAWQMQLDLLYQERVNALRRRGTAVGTGINTRPQFGKAFAADLCLTWRKK